ncbi:MAG: GAF domain-containing protein [Streptosporangiales bacterium]|nr:GAF domain-containing protein [Streptosporangiales bacterium]
MGTVAADWVSYGKGTKLGEAFEEVHRHLVGGRPLRETLRLIAERVTQLADFKFCGVMLPDAAGERLRLAGSHGFPNDYARAINALRPIRLQGSELAPTSRAFLSRTPVAVGDVFRDDSFGPWRDLAAQYGYRALLCVPLIVDDEVVGILNGYSGRTRVWADHEIRTVRALAGQAAIAVKLATLVEDQKETIQRLADLNETLERERWILERTQDIHYRLTEAVIVGGGIERVAQALSGLVGNPVAVWDGDGSVICTAGARNNGDSPGRLVANPALKRLLRAWPNRERAVSVPASRGRASAVVAPILIGDEALGYVAIEERNTAVEEIDLKAVKWAAIAFALEFVKVRVERKTEERLHRDFLFDLLQGRYDSGERITDRARHYGLDLAAPHRVVVMDVDDWGGYAACAFLTETQATRMREAVVEAVARGFRARVPGAVLTTVSDRVTAVCPAPEVADERDPVNLALDEVRRRVAAVAGGLTISAGVGTKTRSADDFVASHDEAATCLRILRQLARRGATLKADDIGIFRLLLDSKEPAELLRFAREILENVARHDKRKGTDVHGTLETYLDRDCDLRATADALAVHPNTVKYRLRKAEELSGLNLKNPHHLMQLSLACLVSRLYEGEQLANAGTNSVGRSGARPRFGFAAL